jgi:PDZ domain-containing protein
MAFPLPNMSIGLGHDTNGIVGGEFIKQFVMELDYQARAITLHDRRTFKYRGTGQTLPLEFTPSGHPVVKATVTPVGGKPIERRFLLDTGSGLALALHSPFVAEQDLLGPQSKTIRAIGMAGAGGTSVGRLGRVSALQIGSSTISGPITLFSQDQAGAFADRSLAGNIGAQVISRFRTFFDYGGRRMIVEPSPTLSEPFDRAMSGMAVRAEGPDYRIFRVKDVLEDSPAAEAGIEEGDVITSIDGAGTDSLTLTMVSEMFEKPVPRQLTIMRGDKTVTATLTPRRLV